MHGTTYTLGEIANTLISGTDVITRFMLLITILMGVGFILFSIGLFRTHRMNPKLVPLDRVVIYLVLGVVLCSIPFLGNFVAETQSTLDLKKNGMVLDHNNIDTAVIDTDIDAPLNLN